MIKESDISINSDSIRREWDEKRNTWYFSVVDVIAIITQSSDPRNYWKVLKSRLNKGNKELVTKCNQLKMPSSDGKSYLTDTADSDTLLEIIKLVSIPSVSPFRKWFDHIEASANTKDISLWSTDDCAELMIDAYQTEKEIVVESLVASVAAEDISITVDCNTLTIRGKRLLPTHIANENHMLQEIYWGIFARTLALPDEVDIDEVEASIHHGLLKVKLPKIDKMRTRIIKIKSPD